LIIDDIPIEIIIGNPFIRKYELHYHYTYNFFYKNYKYYKFLKLNFQKFFSSLKKYKNFKNFKIKNKNHNVLSYSSINNYT